MSFFAVDQRVLVFDPAEWQVTGDVGDNSQFYKPAVIKRLYDYDGHEVADVKFDHVERISTAHFTWGFKQWICDCVSWATIKCEGEVTFDIDPYAHDVHNVKTLRLLCVRHRHEVTMDI
jgi:hypothetical protein